MRSILKALSPNLSGLSGPLDDTAMLGLGWGLSGNGKTGGKSAPTSKSSQKETEKNVPKDIDKKVVDAAKGKEDKLESGGDENDIKKAMENDGKVTSETVNAPDASTIKSKMSEEGVTGGVILVPGHAVAVKPGDDGSDAVPQKQSGSCWCYAAVTAATKGDKSKSKSGGPVVYDSGGGQKQKLEEFAQSQQIEGLIVAKEKKATA